MMNLFLAEVFSIIYLSGAFLLLTYVFVVGMRAYNQILKVDVRMEKKDEKAT